MGGALSGIRVLDLSQVAAGPYCCSLLGDMGADVIKIEPPEGDMMRGLDRVFPGANSSYFVGVNRNKRAMVLNLTLPEGRALFHRLVATSDVVVQNYRPQVLARLGIDYPTLRAINPRLIYCAITAFGDDGPLADKPGMDPIVQAKGGLMGITGEPDGAPVKVGSPIGDFLTSFLACYGITLALLHRERQGEGQQVSLNLLDSVVAALANLATGFLATGREPGRWGGAHPQIAPYQTFATADRYVMVACLNDRFYQRLCNVLGRPEWAEDPRYRTNPERVANREELVATLTEIFRQRPAAEWLALLDAADIPCTLVNDFSELFREPQVLHNGMVVDLHHAAAGPIKVLGNPLKLSATPAAITKAAPLLGEDSQAIARELGVSEAEIRLLQEQGVFGGVKGGPAR